MGIGLRFADPRDAEALGQHWREESGWGVDQLGDWLQQAPFGPAEVVVAQARDSGRIVGQFRFIPTVVQAGGRTFSAIRPFGTIVSKAYRAGLASLNPLSQPPVAMYRFGVSQFRARGVQLVHMLPDPRWARLLRMFPVLQVHAFPLWSIGLPRELPAPTSDFVEHRVTAWDGGVDRLWVRAQRLHHCGVVRNARMLAWKIGSGDHTVIGVRRGSELVGLVGCREKGDGQWLICDLLAADASACLQATLTAALRAGNARSARVGRPIVKAGILATPVLEPVLTALGFAPEGFRMPLVIHLLDETLDAGELAPARWYVTASD
jgi:hypothetical protein